jgi:hypothetical protein
VEAAQGNRTSVRPKPSRFTPESASSAKSPAPQSELPHTRLTPNTQRSTENCPDRAKLHAGRSDLAFHARLMELALQAANTVELLPATFGFLQHHG